MNTSVAIARPARQELTQYEQNILRVLLYFNIFNHPLTAEEIYSFLPSNSTTPQQLTERLESGALQKVVASKKGYFFLSSAPESCIDERQRKEHLARRRTRTAFLVARFIRLFPFVRAVMLSGELSKGVASDNSDIDFVIVTKKRRLWICRSLLILFKKIFLLNSRKYFCLNHFVTEDFMSADLRNIYSATEIATLKPLSNQAQYLAYIRANEWIKEFLPNWSLADVGRLNQGASGSGIQQALEWLVPQALGDRVDAWLLSRWRELWRRRYPGLSDEERRHKFRCEADISTAYGQDFQQKVLIEYAFRLRRFGLAGLEQRN